MIPSSSYFAPLLPLAYDQYLYFPSGGYYYQGDDEEDESGRFQRRLAHTISSDSIRDRDRDTLQGKSMSRGRTPSDTPPLCSRPRSYPNSMEMSVRPLSTYAKKALHEVTQRFSNDACEVSELLESALGADPSNFKKVRTRTRLFPSLLLFESFFGIDLWWKILIY
jgi:hypothetical protein